MQTLKAMAATFALLAICAPLRAHAASPEEALSKCMAQATKADDKTTLTTWIYSAMSAHPQIEAFSPIAQAKRDQATADMAKLTLRLLTADCRKETIQALQTGQQTAVEPAFETLGKEAMEGLMSDPKVEGELQKFALAIMKPEFIALVFEANAAKPN
jgi:hypothetical protein